MNAVTEPASRPPVIAAGGAVKAIVPQSMEDAYRMAKAVCAAGLAPKGMATPEACMVAILHGMEIGLTPMAALQRIAVVGNRPTIWGDGAIGLVRASGLCEYVHERIEGQGDSQTAICTAKRKGEKEPIIGRFSVADARRAKLWGKEGPWTFYPQRMLQMRARAFALRDGFADVLGGLYLREEMDTPIIDVTPEQSSLDSAAAEGVSSDPPLTKESPAAEPLQAGEGSDESPSSPQEDGDPLVAAATDGRAAR